MQVSTTQLQVYQKQKTKKLKLKQKLLANNFGDSLHYVFSTDVKFS